MPEMRKKTPMRQCLGCREMKQKKELIRIVKSPEGVVSLDLSGKKPGRGAYVCHKTDCLKKVIKSGAIARTLKAQISEDITNELLKQMENNETTDES